MQLVSAPLSQAKALVAHLRDQAESRIEDRVLGSKVIELVEELLLRKFTQLDREEGSSVRRLVEAGSEATRGAGNFYNLIKVAHRLATADPYRAAERAAFAFTRAQWAQGSEAAASLAQMAARGVAGNEALSRLVRERQDLVGERLGRNKGSE